MRSVFKLLTGSVQCSLNWHNTFLYTVVLNIYECFWSTTIHFQQLKIGLVLNYKFG